MTRAETEMKSGHKFALLDQSALLPASTVSMELLTREIGAKCSYANFLQSAHSVQAVRCLGAIVKFPLHENKIASVHSIGLTGICNNVRTVDIPSACAVLLSSKHVDTRAVSLHNATNLVNFY